MCLLWGSFLFRTQRTWNLDVVFWFEALRINVRVFGFGVYVSLDMCDATNHRVAVEFLPNASLNAINVKHETLRCSFMHANETLCNASTHATQQAHVITQQGHIRFHDICDAHTMKNNQVHEWEIDGSLLQKRSLLLLLQALPLASNFGKRPNNYLHFHLKRRMLVRTLHPPTQMAAPGFLHLRPTVSLLIQWLPSALGQ